MNNFTIVMTVKSEKLNSKTFLRLYKQNMMLTFMDIKSKEPKLTQKKICNQLSYSDITIKQFRDDIQMDNPNETKKERKKNNKPNIPITQTESNTKNGKFKNNKKNDLTGGFSLENDQQDNTNFFYIS